MNQDIEHLRLLSIFHYVVAGIGALVSCFPVFHLAFGLVMLFAPGISNMAPREIRRCCDSLGSYSLLRRGLHAHRLDNFVLRLFGGTISWPPPTLHVLSGHGGHPVRHGSLRHCAGRVYDHRAGAALGEGAVRARGRRTAGQSIAAGMRVLMLRRTLPNLSAAIALLALFGPAAKLSAAARRPAIPLSRVSTASRLQPTTGSTRRATGRCRSGSTFPRRAKGRFR